MKQLIIFLFLSISQINWAQPKIDTITILSNESIVKFESELQSIYFFCPISSVKKSEYLDKYSDFIKKKKIQALSETHLKMIFFNDNPKNRSKGLRAYFSKEDSLIIINEFAVIFQNFEGSKLIFTSQREEIKKYYGIKFYSKSNLSNVSINESVGCYNSLSERIPNYENFISQLINPIFSESERITFLEDSINLYKRQIESLEKKLLIQSNRIDEIEKKILMQKNEKQNK